ncbi:DUF6884 domain-containing protein [Pseudalkalibacillus caeni]|uniref:DUF6884 domain-containing protein n=1 Tax=Exobacillus caeni TaxID=2574798 RepID=A0A5R9F9X8_9BACL|nr:DUF6884 domain-containing protein [Pseudalkalibacillus caeni]TLS39050.1 hypothetical protein FCL54_01700 [Pseudalkalibacillus caeni]
MKQKVGLLATARKKNNKPAPVTEFYQSPLFQKSLEYAKQNYARMYFYNAKDGLLLPNDMMDPYDVSIKTFTHQEREEWAEKVVENFSKVENPSKVIVYLHGGAVYRKHLEPKLEKHNFEYEVPLKGLGIGEQLNWYQKKLG